MTQKLYHEDPYRMKFQAQVVERLTQDGHPAVVLDRTAFYPTSGGQPHDVGELGGARVLDVVERGEKVLHLLDGDLSSNIVAGEVDWPRRRDHMQQHHGQHLLSAAFERLFGAETTSFHLGDETCSIDLAKSLKQEEVETAEDLTNTVIWEGRIVTAGWFSPDEVAARGMRNPPKVAGSLRLIEIENFDINPCCGTHPKSTGEVGTLTIIGVEPRKGGTRVSFLCGERVVRFSRRSTGILKALGARLSAGRDALEAAVARLQAEHASIRKALAATDERLLVLDVTELRSAAIQAGTVQVIVKVLELRDVPYLRSLATALTATSGTMAVLGGSGTGSSLVIARSSDITIDVRKIGQKVIGSIQGKGGGSPQLFQGSGSGADIHAAVDLAARLVSEELG